MVNVISIQDVLVHKAIKVEIVQNVSVPLVLPGQIKPRQQMSHTIVLNVPIVDCVIVQQSGFTGSACERLACASRCNNKGICLSMHDLAAKRRSFDSQKYTYDDIWDANKIQGCVCDYPTFGYDCSQQRCPSGDDPLTPGQLNEIQLVKCTSNTGGFTLFFEGMPSLWISHSANADAVRTALLKIPMLGDVKVTFSMPYGTACQIRSNIIIIEFTQLFGSLSPLVGQPDRTMAAAGGYIDVNADGATRWTDIAGHVVRSQKGTKEDDLCSNRGACDRNSGICQCYDTNGDVYGSSDGYGNVGSRGDCGYVVSSTETNVSTCPGLLACSGHGVCDPQTFRCYCQFPYTSGDCSQMSCPLGRSWFSYPTADEESHLQYTVCADMGLCDGTTGQCRCREGFYGEACEYMKCPSGNNIQTDVNNIYTNNNNFCSGHGRCMTMAELALWSTFNGDATDFTYGTEANNINTWDADRIHGCLCDEGYSGYDCSLRLCPIGDDPGTYDDHSEVQLIQCIATGGNLTFSFRQDTTVVLPYNITAPQLQAALSALPSITNLSVYFIYDGKPPKGVLNYVKPVLTPPAGMPNWAQFVGGDRNLTELVYNNSAIIQNSTLCHSAGSQVAILLFTHTHGDLPAVQVDNSLLQDSINSNGELGSGTVNIFQDGASVLGLQSVRGTTETDICNNRGLCNYQTGQCQCFPTWTSSDGARQGQSGDTGDCGYRNDHLYSSFNSVKFP
eukprot:scaffold423_cov185-Ochromonas_danica.AAC.5